MGFEVIDGGRTSSGSIYCTWCADRFETRQALEEHWQASPRCGSNKTASNPLQSKYGMAEGIENIPGERTLQAVRSAGCYHPWELRELLRESMDPASKVLGYRCGYCYTEVYE